MQDYVLVHAQPADMQSHTDWYGDVDVPVLLVKKKNPPWQVGKYNLVGGKIEPGESPVDAAIREFIEEAGPNKKERTPEQMGIVKGDWGNIYCFKKSVDADFFPSQAIEKVVWMDWEKAKNHEDLMPNLRIIIPLLAMGLRGWAITDNGEFWGQDRHLITVDIRGTKAVVENSIDQW